VLVLLFIGLPLVLGGAFVLALAIRSLGRAYGRAEVLRAPLVPYQQVALPGAGELRLCLDGPKGWPWHAPLRFALAEAVTGRPVALTPTLGGTGRQRLDRSRVERARLLLPGPGSYALQVEGLQAGPEHRDCFLVFMRPFATTTVLHILGIVACGLGLVGGLVLSILGLALR
jgi:hypothetical protein